MYNRESSVEGYLNKKIKENNGISVKLNPLWFAGIPDRIAFFPKNRFFLIETKKPKNGVLSEIQKYVHRRFEKIGIKVWLLSSKEEIQKFLVLNNIRPTE